MPAQELAVELEETCKDYNSIDADSLLEAEEEDEKYKKAIKNTYKKHYGKTKAQIDAENNRIISTQKKCLGFVKQYRGLPKVCNWCRHAKAPKDRWKWVPAEHVWYKWYDNKWHYWGPSKSGFTAIGWTWYKGYWHHGGYVFKYFNHKWYRFQGHRWVLFGKRVPLAPKPPRGKPICRPFYKLERRGFPASLAVRRMPRCKVGSGKHATIFIWKGRKACNFLGGKLFYMERETCHHGRAHQWKRVVRCVKGPILSGKGLNYHTGKALKKALKKHLKKKGKK